MVAVDSAGSGVGLARGDGVDEALGESTGADIAITNAVGDGSLVGAAARLITTTAVGATRAPGAANETGAIVAAGDGVGGAASAHEMKVRTETGTPIATWIGRDRIRTLSPHVLAPKDSEERRAGSHRVIARRPPA
jgi:hypothetical protein